ncbi:unnamed protein product [Dovyalis caffra]|uniref:DC1 domain-containing protein n=1 Tax=Dovyalis caffra TaxID=77055 RepID=A0AAV1QRG9_9ROSI|nr:unnamed protein product [Dovyalis caffra]
MAKISHFNGRDALDALKNHARDVLLTRRLCRITTHGNSYAKNAESISMKIPSEKYDFSSTIDGCQFYHEFRSSCPDCLLRANIKGEYLPTIHNYIDHRHPLNFIIMPFSFNYQYKCCACDEMEKFVSYKCFQCNYDLHTKCALAVTKDVILRQMELGIKGVQMRSTDLGKSLADGKLTEQEQIAFSNELKNCDELLKLHDQFSGFLNLSQPTHYDRLVNLANSTGATLIIIHGKTENDQGGHDVGVGHVPTVGVDTTKPFIVEDLISVMLQAARRNESIDIDLEPKGDKIVAPPSDHNKRDERDLGDMHVHEFELSKEPKKKSRLAPSAKT